MSYTLRAILGAREVFKQWRNESLAYAELTFRPESGRHPLLPDLRAV